MTDALNQPYDLKSIMHYGNKAFSKNGGDTIISRKYPWLKLGAKKEKLSTSDTKELNQLYKCNPRSRRRLGYYSKFLKVCLRKRSCLNCHPLKDNYRKKAIKFLFLHTWRTVMEVKKLFHTFSLTFLLSAIFTNENTNQKNHN